MHLRKKLQDKIRKTIYTYSVNDITVASGMVLV